MRWAEAECQRQQLPVTFGNKQKVLGKALSLIRFPLMTIEEFAAGRATPWPESVCNWPSASLCVLEEKQLVFRSSSPMIHECECV